MPIIESLIQWGIAFAIENLPGVIRRASRPKGPDEPSNPLPSKEVDRQRQQAASAAHAFPAPEITEHAEPAKEVEKGDPDDG